MAAFSRHTFNSKNYLSHRPTYTQLLYKIIYDYHQLPFGTAVDLGCGPVRVFFFQMLRVGYRNRRVIQEISQGHRNGSLGEDALNGPNTHHKDRKTATRI